MGLGLGLVLRGCFARVSYKGEHSGLAFFEGYSCMGSACRIVRSFR